MAVSKNCPQCDKSMEIPQPPPDKLPCPHCGSVIKFRKGDDPSIKPAKNKAADKTDPSKEDESPRPRKSGGFLSFIHTIIPKPVLFGFYGALGGLLGVLFFGELLWQVLHPVPVVVEPLQVALSPSVTMLPGTQNVVSVEILRQGFDGPVKFEATDLPWDMEVLETTIEAGQTKAEIQINANDKADESKVHEVKIIATGTDKDNKTRSIVVTKPLQIKVEPTPKTLQVTASKIVTVYPGGRNEIECIIARRLFEGPVRLEVLDQPKEFQIPLLTLPDKVDKGKLNITVSKDAQVGYHKLTIEGRSLVDHRITGRETFQLNVEPPPGKLQLAVSPQVTVYPGTNNKFSVRVARQEFNAAIQIDVTGAPPGVQFTSKTIPPDQSETEVEIFADKSAAVSATPVKNLRVTARALLPEEIASSVPLNLRVQLPAPTVQLTVSPKVPVYPGGKATFGVKIGRARFETPVRVSLQPDAKTSGFLTSTPKVIPADQTEGELEVSVGTAALNLPLPQTFPLTVTAVSADGRTTTNEKINVEVLAPPSDLQLTVSPEVDVYQAGRCQFTVKIARSGFLGPVQVMFNNAPAGVTFVPGPVNPKNPDDLVFRGNATIDVEPKKYEIEVVGTGPKAPDGKIPTAIKKFDLLVKPFDPSIRPPLDIVFVLDVTNSMDPQIQGVRNGVGQFVKALRDKELDVRIGLVAFRDILFDDVPFEILKFNGDPFTTDTKVFAGEVGKLKAMGGGDDPESSLDAMDKAASLPFRDNALRVLLLITDAAPQKKGNSLQMPAALKQLKAKKIDQVHLIVKQADLPSYQALQKMPGGFKGGYFDFEKVSKKTKDSEGFASLLPILSKEIVTTIGAPEPVAKIPAQPGSAPPPPPPAGEKPPEPKAEAKAAAPRPEVPQPPKAGEAGTIRADPPMPPEAEKATPPVAERPSVQALQSTQMYADKDRVQLMMTIALWTATMAGGIALLLVGAQKRYLRQAWLSLGEAGRALGAGMAAGLIAGLVGQWFFQNTSGTAWWGFVSRLVGWAILGGLIGAGMGFFVPNLRLRRAFLGGSIGGLIGAIGFAIISFVAGDLLGRWIGAALVGLLIGIMVALAEITFRRYWLEVAFGREVRTVTLGPTTVSVGGDEKLVGVYVPDAPGKALGYRVDRNRVIVEDFATGKTADALPGEERPLAGAKLKVCSAANAVATGVNLQLIVVREVALMEGMPLTSDDIPGLEAQGKDGIVALVNRRPNNPKVFLLRNRSKQSWLVTEADGNQRKVDPGLGIELSSRCEVNFGQVKGTLDPGV